MILTFYEPPQARGQGLCDIDSKVTSYSEKFQKIESPGTAELDRFFVKWENSNYLSNFAVSGISIFLKFFWGTPNYTLSISHSPCPLEAHEMLRSLNLP